MQSEDSSQVCQIKMNSEECSHRIVELIWHNNCTKSAQICEKNCISNQHHDFPKFSHNKISIEDFKALFSKLEDQSSRQTQHYIRQINDIEKIAQENIRKKKQQLFKEIQQVKLFIVKKTYKDLQFRFENLYEKYKGQRFESLKCNEVGWVARTPIASHPIKHSIINSKLQAILKKFQNFKEVSKNYAKPVQKQKAKQAKLSQKLQETMIKVVPSLKLPRPDYSTQSSMIDKRRIKELEERLKDITQSKRYLTEYITKQYNKQRKKAQKLLIVKNIFEVKIESLIKYTKQNPSESRNTIINGINMSGDLKAREGLFSNILHKNSINIIKTSNNSEANDKIISPQRIQRRISQSKQQIMPQSASKGEKNVQKLGQIVFPSINVNFNLQQSHQKNLNQNNQKDASESLSNKRAQPPISPQYPSLRAQIQPESVQKPSIKENIQRRQQSQSLSNSRNIINQEQNLSKRQNLQRPSQIRQQVQQPIVKNEQTQMTYEKWQHPSLIQQMKKNGQNQLSGLKVENIDAIRRFPNIRLDLPRALQIPRPLMQGISKNRQQNPSTYNLYALELIDKQIRKKQGPATPNNE